METKRFDELEKKISSKKAELDQLMQEFQKKMRSEFSELTKVFFEETGVQCIAWHQYTPYFNDGEECVFSINNPVFITKNFDPEDLMHPDDYDYTDDEDGYGVVDLPYRWNWRATEALTGTLELACHKFRELMYSNEGLFRDMFGDHVTVYLTTGEPIVEEYDHE